MDRPWLPFYASDWLSNGNLRRCSHAEKGVWIDLMCFMHDAEEYGVLRWSLKEISSALGCKLSELKGLIDKGVLKGADKGQKSQILEFTPISGRKKGPTVTVLAEQDGPLWYSSRMVIDEYKRLKRGGSSDSFDVPPTHSPKGGFSDSFDENQSQHPPRGRLSESESESYNPVTESVSNSVIVGAETQNPKTTPTQNLDRPTPVNPDFVPNEHCERIAKEHGLNLASERERFVAHHEGLGTLRSNWQSSFKKWLLDAMQFRADNAAKGGGRSKPDQEKFNPHVVPPASAHTADAERNAIGLDMSPEARAARWEGIQ